MRAKVGEVKSTHCLCTVVIYLSRLYKCRVSFIRVHMVLCVKMYRSIDITRIFQLITADDNTSNLLLRICITVSITLFIEKR